MKPDSDQEENELVILHLRQLCENKQKTHIHIGETPSVNLVLQYWSPSSHPFKMQPWIQARPLQDFVGDNWS